MHRGGVRQVDEVRAKAKYEADVQFLPGVITEPPKPYFEKAAEFIGLLQVNTAVVVAAAAAGEYCCCWCCCCRAANKL